jgi:eukaryotic-like serine/threonine-protein kinase
MPVKATDRFVLPTDVLVLPVATLAFDLRMRLDAEPGDVVVSRKRSRSNSRLVDHDAAQLLEEFRDATSIVQAVVRFSTREGLDPYEVLTESLPLISSLVQAGLLASEDDPLHEPVVAIQVPGDVVGGARLETEIQVLPDSEVWRAKLDSRPVALKLGRTRSGDAAIDREAMILERLHGNGAPALLAVGSRSERRFLISEWVEGTSLDDAMRPLREGGARRRSQLVELVARLIEAIGGVHVLGVVHGDVHPRNFIVRPDGQVVAVDFGLSELIDTSEEGAIGRGAVGHYVEPEYAHALLAELPPPPATILSDQYASGVIAFRALTGQHPIDLAFDQQRSWQQIAHVEPRGFGAVGADPWPEVEAVLRRGLAKAPTSRYSSMSDFAGDFRRAARSKPLRGTLRGRTGGLLELGLLQYRRGDGQALPGPTASVNYGAAGIAYAFLRVAAARHDPALLAAADLWAVRADADRSDEGFEAPDLGLPTGLAESGSLFHGRSGVAMVRALVAGSLGPAGGARSQIEAFVTRSVDAGELDATMGAASSLLGAAALVETFKQRDRVGLRPVYELGQRLEGQLLGAIAGPQAIVDGPIRYLGFAHGWAGLLYAVMRWRLAILEPIPSEVATRAIELASHATVERSVAWLPVEADRTTWGNRPWAGWCHGSAGHLLFAIAAARAVEESTFSTLALRLGGHVAEQEARPIGQLCCGLGGQAYALAALARYTEDPAWFMKAKRLADRAARVVTDEASHRRGSLFKGDTGVALLLSDLDAGNGFPLVEPEA